jgi:D-alanyl-D-alanine carboxypeptidase/D-alanyl-D-alanine-endopeptidase (penicillin-binding protein 4)
MQDNSQTISVTNRCFLGTLISLSALLFLSSAPQASTEIELLRGDLTPMVNDEALRSAHVGIAIQSVNNRAPLFLYNEEKRFVSASNMKLYTTAAALLSLSPDFTYETKVMTNGSITQGILKGDLIIVASGDPTISGYFNNNNPIQVFENWGNALVQKGIRKIDGDIVIDNAYFNDSPFGAGWHWDDMSSCYSTAKDAFSFNNNCIALTVSPGNKIGVPAIIEIEPKTGYVTVSNNITTAGERSTVDIKAEYTNNSKTIVMSGTIPLNHKSAVKYVAAKHPAEFGAYVLKETFLSKGIEVNGNIVCTRSDCEQIKDIKALKINGEPPCLTTLAIYRSPKLSEIIKVINKISNNLYAENLFLTIAKERHKEGNSEEAALAVRKILKETGLNPEGLHMVDGSGLSRFNLITPNGTVQLLLNMARSPHAEAFYNSLAIPGDDGTLKARRKETSAIALINIKAKTGTMTHVRNLSGYVTSKNGELLAFSFLCNNHNVPGNVIDSLYDRILARLAKFILPDPD